MEVKPFRIEGGVNVFSKFHKSLEDAGYEDLHAKSVRESFKTLAGILKVDFLKQKSLDQVLSSPRSLLLINPASKAAVVLRTPEMRNRQRESSTLLVLCYSDSLKNANSLVDALKEILTSKVGVSKKKIHDGDLDAAANKRCISSLAENQRSQLIKAVNGNMLKVFIDKGSRSVLRKLVNFPLKVFSEDMFKRHGLGELNLTDVTSSGIFDELFSPTCKNCEGEISSPFLFGSKDEITPVLEKKTLVCPNCGLGLDPGNTVIMRYFRFTKLGLEMAKGLWLEAYAYSVVRETGIPKTDIAVCACHGKDELDMVFSDGRYLYVCECKDRVVGQNDVYVLAMKANRISSDEKVRARVDKVLMISTEPISKDILSEGKTGDNYEEIDYIPVSGDLGSIKEKLVGLIEKSRRQYKKDRINGLSQLLIRPVSPEEEYMRQRLRLPPPDDFEDFPFDEPE